MHFLKFPIRQSLHNSDFQRLFFFGLQNFDVTQFKKEGLKNKWQYCFAVTESGTQFQEELVQFVGWLIAF